MREIKFRAWQIDQNTMIQFEKIKYLDLLDSQINIRYTWNFDETLEDTLTLSLAHFELMQYTGLKDKNGKEIYEGDIIDQHRDKCVIKRCIGGFDCKMICGASKGSTFIFSFLHSPSCEVIGNIYENPELMEKIP